MDWAPEVEEIVGRFIAASNATLLGRTTDGLMCVYKPTAGERPLWDFPPHTLAAREVLTYEVSRAMGYDVVPETQFGTGPYGDGAVQRFIEIDERADPLEMVEEGDPRLWPVVVLDLVCNNADRKVGHLFFEEGSGRLYAVDHGLNFHVEDKLRTVLWSFAGLTIPDAEMDALDRLREMLTGDLGATVADHLDADEVDALFGRVTALLGRPVHPHPPLDRPAIPWPPY